MDETFFYVVGGVLVALALIISLIGMRSDKFPTNGQLWVGVLLTAVVVVATSAGAVSSSQEEAEHREAENAEATEALAEETAENEEESGGGTGSSIQEEPEDETLPGDDLSSGSGREVFVDNGCGSCHTIAAVPEAAGQIGPNLDESLDDEDEEFIRKSIIAPDVFVEEGYGSGIMPDDYETELAPEDIDALVTFLSQSTSNAGEPSAGGSSTSK